MHRSRFWKYDNRRSTIHVVFERVLEKKSKEEPISNHSREEAAPGIQLELHLLWIPYPCDLSLEPMWQDPSTGSLGRTADGHFPIFPYQLIISVVIIGGRGVEPNDVRIVDKRSLSQVLWSCLICHLNVNLLFSSLFIIFWKAFIIYLWITLVNWM